MNGFIHLPLVPSLSRGIFSGRPQVLPKHSCIRIPPREVGRFTFLRALFRLPRVGAPLYTFPDFQAEIISDQVWCSSKLSDLDC